MDVDWFLGFSEGEGNFSVLFTTKSYRDRKYVWAKPTYSLRQAEQKVIDEVTKFLEEQGIKSKSHRFPSKYSSLTKTPTIKRDTWLLQVIEQESVRKMIELLDSLEWHSQKRSDFEKWKQCIKIIEEHPSLHTTGRKTIDSWRQWICDLLKINNIAQEMNVAIKRRVWTPEHLINHLKTNRPYNDFDFVKKLKADGKLEENLRILGCS